MIDIKQSGYFLDVHYLNYFVETGEEDNAKKYMVTQAMKMFWDNENRKFFWYDFPEDDKHYPFSYVYDPLKQFSVDPKYLNRIIKKTTEYRYHPLWKKSIPLDVYYCNSPSDIKLVTPEPELERLRDEQTGWVEPNKLYRKRMPYHVFENHVTYTTRFAADKDMFYGMKYHIDNNNRLIKPDLTSKERNSFNDALEKLKDTTIPDEMKQSLLPTMITEIPTLPAIAIDIECAIRGPVLPNPKIAPEPIIAISFKFSDKEVYNGLLGVVIALDRKMRDTKKGFSKEMLEKIASGEAEVEWYDSETLLLERFKYIIDHSKAALIFTFNGDDFDFKYLHNRMRLYNIKSPFRIRGKIGTDKERVQYEPSDTDGDLIVDLYKIHIDLYKFFKMPYISAYVFSNKYSNNKLDTIGEALIHRKKIDHELSIDELTLWELVYYNYIDSDITLELAFFDNAIVQKIIIMFMRIGFNTMTECPRLGITNKIGNLMMWRANDRGWIIPRKIDKDNEEAVSISTTGKRFEGAFNPDPIKGIFFGVEVFDFEGLYTNIISNWNISPETMLCLHDSCKSNRVPFVNYWVCKKLRGLAPEVMEFITKVRGKIFKPLKKVNETLWKPVEQGLKVFGNAGWGYLSADFSDWYSMPSSESITAIGRDAIKRLIEKAHLLKMMVIRGDTDSAFLIFGTPERTALLMKYSEEVLGFTLTLEYEGVFILNTDLKKNYYVYKTDGKEEIKGLKLKKSNTPEIIKRAAKEAIEIIKPMKSQKDIPFTKDKLTKHLKKYIKIIRGLEGDLNDYAYYTKITKPLHKYEIKPPHVKAAEVEARRTMENIPPAVRHTVNVEDLIPVGKVQSHIKIKMKPNSYPTSLTERINVNVPKYLEELDSTLSQLIGMFGIDFNELVNKKKELNQFF